ncbi:MAG: hypothetical protein ACXWEH_07650 [Actinomycetota bacterium]
MDDPAGRNSKSATSVPSTGRCAVYMNAASVETRTVMKIAANGADVARRRASPVRS